MRTLLKIIIASLCALAANGAIAADSPLTSPSLSLAQPRLGSGGKLIVNPLDKKQEFIMTWYICGPFAKSGSKELRQRWANPKDAPTPDPSRLSREKYPAKGGSAGWQTREIETTPMLSEDPLSHKIRPLDTRIINYQKVFPNDLIDSSAYGLAFVSAPTSQTCSLYFGSDDGITVWLNGRQIHRMDKDRPIVPDEDFVIANFEPGINNLLVEVTNTKGYWGFMMRIAAGSKSVPLSLPVDIKVN